MKSWKLLGTASAALLMLTACGGGGGEATSNPLGLTSIVSFGDSLSDVGTHNVGSVGQLSAATGGGGRWTTNSTAGGEIWLERLSKAYALPVSCAAEVGLLPNIPGLTGAAPVAKAGCTNYAQGSARVTSPLGPNSVALQALGETTLGLIAKPIEKQMEAHLAAVGGQYSGKELVTILAGANDVFMELAFIGTQLGAPTPQEAVVKVATAGATLGELIKTQVVAKGAKQVLVLNVPDVAGTPFAKTFDAPTQGLIDAMVTSFNAQLTKTLAGVPGVRVADAYAVSKDQGANPAAYGLTNTTGVACGPNSLSNPPTTNGTSLVCNASNLVAGDVSRYQFADDVHPTAYGHQLLAQFAAKALAAAGWL